MRKVLSGIFVSIALLFFVRGVSFADTLSFTAKDGRVFCESTNYDGSYRECSQGQILKNDLVIPMGSSPRLIETSLERKCVQKGEEVDIEACEEDMEGLKAVYPTNVPTGPSITSVDPREVTPPEIIPEVIHTGKILTGTSLAHSGLSIVPIVAPMQEAIQKIDMETIQASIAKILDNQMIVIGIIIFVSVIVLGSGVMIYMKKRKVAAAVPMQIITTAMNSIPTYSGPKPIPTSAPSKPSSTGGTFFTDAGTPRPEITITPLNPPQKVTIAPVVTSVPPKPTSQTQSTPLVSTSTPIQTVPTSDKKPNTNTPIAITQSTPFITTGTPFPTPADTTSPVVAAAPASSIIITPSSSTPFISTGKPIVTAPAPTPAPAPAPTILPPTNFLTAAIGDK